MKRFFVQFLLFICPLGIIPGIPTFILWKLNENFYSIDNILMSDKKYLVGYMNEINYDYLKWAYLNLNKKKSVWALGSSRVLQFRSGMFDSSFYNAGYIIRSMTDFVPFLKGLPEAKLPRYLILGLDQWMFNKAFDPMDKTPLIDSWKNSFEYCPKFTTKYRLVYDDFFAGKYSFKNFIQNDSIYCIGENAILNNTGFRNDGSIYYGSTIQKLITKDKSVNDFEFLDTYSRIENGNRRFENSDSINNNALLELNLLLKYCKEEKIKVVAFLPPFAEKVCKKINDLGKHGYINKIYPGITPIFKKYNYEIYDFTNVISCNSNDMEMIDGMHGGELTYQKILISMLDSNSVLNQVANKGRLKAGLNKKKNNFIIYNN